jgi:hypothetical protein
VFNDGSEHIVKLNMSEGVFEQLRVHTNKINNTIHHPIFLLDGGRIKLSDTIHSLGLKNNYMIDVLYNN